MSELRIVSWDSIISNSRGLEHERSLAKTFGVCYGNRKEPFAARPERTGGLVDGILREEDR